MTEFRVWAPKASRVRVRIEGGDTELEALPEGWFAVELADAGPGTDYAYLLDDATSRCRTPPPGGSRTASTARAGCTTSRRSGGPTRQWTGRELPGAVIYELHVGTFTPGARSTRRSSAWTTWSRSA